MVALCVHSTRCGVSDLCFYNTCGKGGCVTTNCHCVDPEVSLTCLCETSMCLLAGTLGSRFRRKVWQLRQRASPSSVRFEPMRGTTAIAEPLPGVSDMCESHLQGSKKTTWKGSMTIETFPHLEELGKIPGVADFLGEWCSPGEDFVFAPVVARWLSRRRSPFIACPLVCC